jgi:hypothetical protein
VHDPLTVAFEIRSPFRDKPTAMFPKGYRHAIITIWHKDPCHDHDDDSCDWFGTPERPWWKHPRWHIWHWRIRIHPLRDLIRWIFDRCSHCGGRFRWKEGKVGNWNGDQVAHFSCAGVSIKQ